MENKVTANGWVYLEVRKGMYGLPQASILAQRLSKERLNKKGYKQSALTLGFWSHQWRHNSFTVCVDAFGVKYVGKQDVEHLMEALRDFYTI